MKNITAKQLNIVSKKYIIDSIDNNYYNDNNLTTDKEKLQFLYNTFKSERYWEFACKCESQSFTDWIMGLPGCFNIVYTNYDIIELAKNWGSLPKISTERDEDKILGNYWNFITVKTFQLFRKFGIK